MEDSDEAIIARVKAGDRDAFADLVRRHHARVHGLCLSLVGPGAVEDASQEVFLKAYDRLDDFHGDSAFSTWLYRVASNHCLDLLRKESRRRSESLEALSERDGERLESLAAEPGDAVRSLEDVDLVRRALAAIPEEYRVILTLRELEGLEYKEIMTAMDCSMDSVKARLQRARRAMTDALRHLSSPRDVSKKRNP